MNKKNGPGRGDHPAGASQHSITTAKITSPGTILLAGHAVYTSTGAIVEAPPAGPADEILTRLHRRLGDNGLVLIAPDTPSWDYLTTSPKSWHVSAGPAWFTVTLDGARLRLAVLENVREKKDNDPLLGDDYVTTVLRHQMYADLTGVPFYGDGGTSGALLMDATINVKGTPPRRSWTDGPRVMEASWPGPWSACAEIPHKVQLDKNAYDLAAANSALLPLDALTYMPGGLVPNRVGLYHLRVPGNPCPQLPHPVGANAKPGQWRWVAQPTVDLLAELGAVVEVDGSWTCERDRARRVLAPWYERLRDARSFLTDSGDEDTLAVRQAVKDTYSRGIGCLDREGRRWYRPDWRAILYAQARTCMWRTMWKAGQGGRWPVETRTDMVVYEGSEPPAEFKVGPGMGQWKVTKR